MILDLIFMDVLKIKNQIKSPYFNGILKISKSSQNDLESDFVKLSIKSLNTRPCINLSPILLALPLYPAASTTTETKKNVKRKQSMRAENSLAFLNDTWNMGYPLGLPGQSFYLTIFWLNFFKGTCVIIYWAWRQVTKAVKTRNFDPSILSGKHCQGLALSLSKVVLSICS
jgi:hypothetical protein